MEVPLFFGDKRDPGVSVLPLLPLRDIIVFPFMVVPLFVGRPKSISALEDAMASGREVLLAAQKKAKTDTPTADEIYRVGTVGYVIQLLRLPDGTVKVLIEGKRRARIRRFLPTDQHISCEVETIAEKAAPEAETEPLMKSLHAAFDDYVKLNKRVPPEMLQSIAAITDPARLSDTIVAHLTLKLTDKQEILETAEPKRRLERLLDLIQSEIEVLLVEKKIRSRVKKQIDKSKEFGVNEQMQAMQKELGDRDEFKNEIQELEARIAKKEMSEEAKGKLKRELKKLKMMSPMSAEATVVRNYIDWVIALPWKDITTDNVDIDQAEEILDADHHGLTKAKERILEYLAVHSLVKRIRGPILCFVGPPGVGKTSLGRSIARAIGRKFVRLSLGGVRDEAEVRGHRRTYIGAMPGKIMQSLRKAESNNPVFLLDEIDKMSTDFRGDPSSALLEVLDPEQNSTFSDHFIDLEYDLSEVMFICTANSLHTIPLPLQDRMEIIEIPGYTELEKVEIARKHLIPKQLEANGLAGVDVRFTDDALRAVISGYTKESGVRNLEREMASVCRKIARDLLKARQAATEGSTVVFRVDAKAIAKFLGPKKFRQHQAELVPKVGVVNGLAVTMVGGDLLTVEVTKMPGKGKLTITGKLGEVMKEAAQAALSYVRSRAPEFGLDVDFFSEHDVHIHYPEGAIPKDGPSAGITTATALASALTGIPVRGDVAMTGEITLRGRVLPIGGLKEKSMAAHRAGILTVIAPRQNKKDIGDIPKTVRKDVRFLFVEHMDEVLHAALEENAFARLLARSVPGPISTAAAHGDEPGGEPSRH